MKNQSEISENKENLGGGVKWYREKIVEMVGQIKNERFLKAIYISISDYLKENEPD